MEREIWMVTIITINMAAVKTQIRIFDTEKDAEVFLLNERYAPIDGNNMYWTSFESMVMKVASVIFTTRDVREKKGV